MAGKSVTRVGAASFRSSVTGNGGGGVSRNDGAGAARRPAEVVGSNVYFQLDPNADVTASDKFIYTPEGLVPISKDADLSGMHSLLICDSSQSEIYKKFAEYAIELCLSDKNEAEKLRDVEAYFSEISSASDVIVTELDNLKEYALESPIKKELIYIAAKLMKQWGVNQPKMANEALRLFKLAANLGHVESMYEYATALNERHDEKNVKILTIIKRYYDTAARHGHKLSEQSLKVLSISDSETVKFKNYPGLAEFFNLSAIKNNNLQSKYLLAKFLCRASYEKFKEKIVALLYDAALKGHANAVYLYKDCLKKEVQAGDKQRGVNFFNKLDQEEKSFHWHYFNAEISRMFNYSQEVLLDLQEKRDFLVKKGYASALYDCYAAKPKERLACFKIAKEVDDIALLGEGLLGYQELAAELGDLDSLKKMVVRQELSEKQLAILDQIKQNTIELTDVERQDYDCQYLFLKLRILLNKCGIDAGVQFFDDEIKTSPYYVKEAAFKKSITEIINKFKKTNKTKNNKKVVSGADSSHEKAALSGGASSVLVDEKPVVESGCSSSLVDQLSVVETEKKADLAVEVTVQKEASAEATPVVAAVVMAAELKSARRSLLVSSAQATASASKVEADEWVCFNRFEYFSDRLKTIFPEELQKNADSIALKLSKTLHINTGRISVNGYKIENISHLSTGNRNKTDGATLFGFIETPVDSAGKRDVVNQTFKPFFVAQHLTTNTYIIRSCDPKLGFKPGQVIKLI